MRSRAVALGLGAAVILGGLVYLFVQVTDGPGPSSTTAAGSDERVAKTGPMWTPPETGSGGPAAPRSTAGVDPPPPRVDRAGGTVPAIEAADGDRAISPDVDLDLAMDEANKLYDHNDYEAAIKQAQRVLDQNPEPKAAIRMTRIIVSAACMMGDSDTATKHFGGLPARDQGDMARRCERYGITLTSNKPALPAGGGGGKGS
jgi:hypothetical protein